MDKRANTHTQKEAGTRTKGTKRPPHGQKGQRSVIPLTNGDLMNKTTIENITKHSKLKGQHGYIRNC